MAAWSQLFAPMAERPSGMFRPRPPSESPRNQPAIDPASIGATVAATVACSLPRGAFSSVLDGRDVLSQKVAAKVPVEIPPHRVDVIAVVLAVVVFNEERRPLN